MKAFPMQIYRMKKSTHLTHTPTLGQIRMCGPQMDPKYAHFSTGKIDLHKRTMQVRVMMPFIMFDLQPAHEPDRMTRAGGPGRHIYCICNILDDLRLTCLLKHHQVR